MLWAITSYFNPCRYRRRIDNYHLFRRNLSAPLITIELGFDGRFDLGDEDADIMVRVAEGDILFQKERLLNLVVEKHLPDECEFVAWLDADVIFEKADWAEQSTRALDRYPILQPMSDVYRIESPDLGFQKAQTAGISPQKTFAARYQSGDLNRELMEASVGGSHYRGGLAWAARREVIANLTLFDSLIVGGGDRVIPNLLCDSSQTVIDRCNMTPRLAESYREWCHRIRKYVPQDCGVVPGKVFQLWHGDYSHRRYQDRFAILHRHDFDPTDDLQLGQDGAWRWRNPESELAKQVANYFHERQEDGLSLPHR